MSSSVPDAPKVEAKQFASLSLSLIYTTFNAHVTVSIQSITSGSLPTVHTNI